MQAWCPKYFAAWITLLCIHRIGRVFTKEAVAHLQSEAGAGSESTGTASTASQLKVSQDEVDVSGCGGLLWRIAWCPLLQVNYLQMLTACVLCVGLCEDCC